MLSLSFFFPFPCTYGALATSLTGERKLTVVPSLDGETDLKKRKERKACSSARE
jgi:hypothetical protein